MMEVIRGWRPLRSRQPIIFFIIFVRRWPAGEEEEGSRPQDARQRGVQRVRRQGLWFPLQRAELRGLQGLLPTQRHQERPVLLQEQWPLRDGLVHATQVPTVPAAQVPGGGHARAV